MSDLIKAFKNGKRGKFRRIDGGKVKFIGCDGVVEKDATTTAAMSADLGSPAADVHLTDDMDRKCEECGKMGPECTCVKKSEKCLCKEKDCDCSKKKTNELDDMIKSLESKVSAYNTRD